MKINHRFGETLAPDPQRCSSTQPRATRKRPQNNLFIRAEGRGALPWVNDHKKPKNSERVQSIRCSNGPISQHLRRNFARSDDRHFTNAWMRIGECLLKKFSRDRNVLAQDTHAQKNISLGRSISRNKKVGYCRKHSLWHQTQRTCGQCRGTCDSNVVGILYRSKKYRHGFHCVCPQVTHFTDGRNRCLNLQICLARVGFSQAEVKRILTHVSHRIGTFRGLGRVCCVVEPSLQFWQGRQTIRPKDFESNFSDQVLVIGITTNDPFEQWCCQTPRNSLSNPLLALRHFLSLPSQKPRNAICPNRTNSNHGLVRWRYVFKCLILQIAVFCQPLTQRPPIIRRLLFAKAEEANGNNHNQPTRTQEQNFPPSPHKTSVAVQTLMFKIQCSASSKSPIHLGALASWWSKPNN